MIIALGKDDRVGKDTVFKIIKKTIDSAERFSFGDVAKKFYANSLGIDVDELEFLIKNDPYYRSGIRSFSKECVKENKRIFTDPILNKIKQSNSPIKVVTDLRFTHELEALKELDEVLHTVLILKDGAVGNSNLSDSDFEFVISNNGTLDDLEREIIFLLHGL